MMNGTPVTLRSSIRQMLFVDTMKVLYLNHSEQMSGAENSLRALLWQLRRAHPDLEAALALPGEGPFSELMREEGWDVSFAPLRRLDRPKSLLAGMSELAYVMRTAPQIAQLAAASGAQLIHSNSTTAHLVGGLAAQKVGKPAIWHARDLVSLQRIAPTLAQRAAAVIAISGCVAEQLKKDGVPATKIRVVHNGIDPEEWAPRGESTLRRSLGLPADTFLFGCVAQLVPWKNQLAFIEAAANIVANEGNAHAHFAVIGGNLWGEQSEYVAKLRTAVKEHNLQERFNFIPHQKDNVDALAALDCVVLPSHEEPFGRVLIEGMALQKPVIAYAEKGPLEIISHEHDGLLVQPEENDGLTKAMQRLLHDDVLCRMLGTTGRETVLTKFHIAESAKRVVEIYNEVNCCEPADAIT